MSTSPSPSREGRGFRRGLSARLDRLRGKIRSPGRPDVSPGPNRKDVVKNDIKITDKVGEASASEKPADPKKDDLQNTSPSTEVIPKETSLPIQNKKHLTHEEIPGSDLWSAAYREAVDKLDPDIDTAILITGNATQLFTDLEKIDKDASEESLFLRGLAHLRSVQVPLERFKLALDLASPLSNLDPAAATVLGVVSSVTAIAISLATADLEFARQVGEMLEQISYIDDCDTLGQRSEKTDIHRALVVVYQRILEFYIAAHEILTQRGRKLALKLILETDRLPSIIQSFLKDSEHLRKLIEKATWEVVEDIKLMLYDREIVQWLDGGKLQQQGEYHDHLQRIRTDDACGFLLENAEFMKWYNSPGSEQLAVLGDMGCGKSVTMAFLVDELNRRNKHQLPRANVCYYYCRSEETGQDVQVLSALVLSLLLQLPGLKKRFYQWYKRMEADGVVYPARSTKHLGRFLEDLLMGLDRQLFIIIDGLDECDRTSRETLFTLLKSLLTKSPRLKVVVSSRPEENIIKKLDKIPKIFVESNSDRDTAIVKYKVEAQLSDMPSDVRTLVTETLSDLAQGSAIWTTMMVTLIETHQIHALEPMRLFLKDMTLPENLSTLYIDLLTRKSSNSPQNKGLAVLALKILASAARPLSLLELAWAVATAAAGPNIKTISELSKWIDPHRLLTLIQPFITRLDSNAAPRKPQIQLVHQSVKEFLIHEWHQLQHYLSAAIPPPQPPDKPLLSSLQPDDFDTFILEVCIKYLLLDEIGETPLFTPEQIAIEDLPQDTDLFADDSVPAEYDAFCSWEAWESDMILFDPVERGFGEFFVYAATQWTRHYGAVRIGHTPELAKIEELCKVGSRRLENWIQQNCRPGCAIRARFAFDAEDYDPLGVAVIYGSDEALRQILQGADWGRDRYLEGSLMEAVRQVTRWGELGRLRILFLEGRARERLWCFEFFQLLVVEWRQWRAIHNDWDVAFDLVNHVVDQMVQEKWGARILRTGTKIGCLSFVQKLLTATKDKPDLKTELVRDPQSVHEAIANNHVSIVQCLLDDEDFKPLFRHVNDKGENMLHVAAGHCNLAMFQLLVPLLEDMIFQADSQGDTPLTRVTKMGNAVHHDTFDCARLLVSHANAKGIPLYSEGQQNPLQVAVQGYVEMCQILLDQGRLDPLSALAPGEDGQLVLKDKPFMNEDAILQLLREHAATASS